MNEDEKRFAKLDHDLAVEEADRWFRDIEIALEGKIREVKQYRDRFHAHVKEGDTPDDVINWTVMSVMQVHSAMRIDMATKHATRVALTRAKLEDD